MMGSIDMEQAEHQYAVRVASYFLFFIGRFALFASTWSTLRRWGIENHVSLSHTASEQGGLRAHFMLSVLFVSGTTRAV